MPISVEARPRSRRATAVVAESNAATLLSTAATFADELERLASDHAEIEASFRERTHASVAEIRRRLTRDELWVAVVGEFKAGKSTFLNAVLGEPLLGAAKAEYTGVNTILRYGAECDYVYETERGAQVRFVDEVPDRRPALQDKIERARRSLNDARQRLRVAVEDERNGGARLERAERNGASAEHQRSEVWGLRERSQLALASLTRETSAAKRREESLALALPSFLRVDAAWWAFWVWIPRLLVGWVWRRLRTEWLAAVTTRQGVQGAQRAAVTQLEETDARFTATEAQHTTAMVEIQAAREALARARRSVAEFEAATRGSEAVIAAAEREIDAHVRERAKRFRENVRTIAAIDRPGAAVKTLTVWHPSPLLQSGLVLLDTPGINTPQKRFEQRAWDAIEREADACVLLTPVSQALSQKTREALARMRQYVPHIALVVTKLDKAEQDVFSDDPDEVQAQVDEVLRGAVRGYAKEMGRAEDDVFWVATAAESAIPETGAFSDESRRKFAAAIDRLTRALASERAAVIGVRAAKLGAAAVQEIRDEVKRVEAVYTQRIKQLEAERLPDPKAEAERLAEGLKPEIEKRLRASKKSHADALDDICDNWMSDVEGAIRSRQKKETLENFAITKIESKIKTLQKRLDVQLRRYVSQASSDIAEITTRAMEEVHDRYRIVAKASNVAVLACEVQVYGATLLSDVRAGVAGVLLGHSDENLYAAGSGAAAGAMIGTFLLPGIGTVVGGFLGGIAGSLFGPSLDDLKEKLVGQCRGVMEQARRQAKKELSALAEQVRADGKRVLDESLAAEVLRFARWIDDLLRAEQRRIDAERRKLADLSERAKKIDVNVQQMTRLSAAIARESALMARSPQPS